MASGDNIPIEERDGDEVRTVWGHRVAPKDVNVINLAFDVTPARYVTAFFTEKGAFRPTDVRKLMRDDIDIVSIRLRPQ
jgi:methylthioribose-1-phosphate isomerase